MEDTVKITKLCAENWSLWKFQMKVILNALEIGDIVSGEWTKPGQPIKKLATESDEDAKARWQRQTSAWIKADGKCQKIIVTSVDDGPLQYLLNCETALEMWEKLLSIYEQKSEASLHLLQQQFFSYTKESTDDMSTHISKLVNLGRKLKVAGEPVTDNMVMTKILMTLPKEYNHFYSAWDSVPTGSKNINNLTSRLLIEESRVIQIKGEVGEQEKSSAFPAKFQNRSDGRNGSRNYGKGKKQFTNKSNIKCYFCGKVGHYKRDCRNFLQSTQGAKTDTTGTNLNAFVSESRINNIATDAWILDSGASDHMSANREWFSSYEPLNNTQQITIGDGTNLYAAGRGNINILSYVNGNWNKNYMANVLHVPGLKYNLFSCGAAMDKGLVMTSNSKTCMLTRQGKPVCSGKRCGRLFELNIKVEEPTNGYVAVAVENRLPVWHARMGHQNIQYVKNCLAKHGIMCSAKNDEFMCSSCIIGKQSRKSFSKSNTEYHNVGDLIHADLCGPMEVSSIGGSKYFLLFKDDYSHYRTVYFIKNKYDVKNIFETFIKSVETGTGSKVKILRTDNGLEFVNKEITSILQKHGIRHQLTVPYTPQQNGKVERENRTIVESARTMICAKNLDVSLWAEAVNTAVYTLNRTGTSSVKNNSPYELYYKVMPDIKHLRVFGTVVYTHIPKQKRKKWDPKSKKGIFVGYSDNTKGYRVYYSKTNTISVSRDIIFENEGNKLENIIVENLEFTDTQIDNDPVKVELTTADNRSGMVLRDRNTLKAPIRYNVSSFVANLEPLSRDEAIAGPHKNEWEQAMSDEINSLHENNTWSLVNLPQGKVALRNAWVFKTKYKSDGNIDKFKARLVIKGCSQKYGIDYHETFSPVVRYESIRAIFAVAAVEKLILRQFDIKTAFLYGELQEEIYMIQPPGFEDGSNKVCKLQRSLYGLKQSPRCWNIRFKNFLNAFGLQCTEADACVFKADKSKIILAIFVDDGLIAADNEEIVDKLLTNLEKEFEVKKGNLDYFLGMQINIMKNGSLFVHQTNYASSIINKFNMLDAKELSIPMDKSHTLEQKEDTEILSEDIPYRQAVGSLLFLSQVTRPDIAYAVNFASRYLAKPTKAHWNLVKRIIRYIKRTFNYGLYFNNKTKLSLEIFSDADYAGDIQTRRSTSGFLFRYGSSIISWTSQRQHCVSLSSTEAEYISASEAVKGILWITRLITSLSTTGDKQPVLFIDNQSTIRLVKNPEFHKRTKHIDVRYHFIREKYEEGQFQLQYIGTEDQIADILTKPLVKERFEKLRSAIGMTTIKEIIN